MRMQLGSWTKDRWRTASGPLIIAAAFIAAVAGVGAGIFLGASPAGAADEIACNGDHPLETEGFNCTPIFNRGNPDRDGDGDVDINDAMGEVFYSISGTTLTVHVNLFFGLSDTGLTDAKICLDDDPDPAETTEPVISCTGADAGTRITVETDGSYSAPLPAPDDGEEDPGDWELLLDEIHNIEQTGTGSAAGLATYTLDIDGWAALGADLRIGFHFNQGDFSLEGFVPPPVNGVETPTPTVDLTATPTVGTPVLTATPTVGTPVVTATPTVGTPVVTATPTVGTPAVTNTPTATATLVPATATPTATATLVPATATPTATLADVTGTPEATPTGTEVAVEATPTATPTGVVGPEVIPPISEVEREVRPPAAQPQPIAGELPSAGTGGEDAALSLTWLALLAGIGGAALVGVATGVRRES